MAKAWHLKSRPQGMPTIDNFELKTIATIPLTDGQIRVRNLWLSVDPYMRGRMNDTRSYVPPFKLDEPMQGGAVGEVIESRDDGFAIGDKVLHMAGWRDEAVISSDAGPQKLPDLGVPLETWLHNLGLTGGTAHIGLLRIAEAKAGETVFVSAAAGAVGSAVVQIARIKGMKVIGSAGGAEKCAWVKELGADTCIDYKAGPVLDQLRAAAPDGIDVYFDNVGGDHLDAALATARNGARFAICGMIDRYNRADPPVLRYLMRIIAARIRMQGFLFFDFAADLGDFQREMAAWIVSSQVRERVTVKDGLEAMPDAFLGLFAGENIGKMLVRL